MAISRSAKISLLLFIDVIFFLVELVIGYAVGSLALVADSFHMLNDVMSLVVALYAIKLTTRVRAGDDNTRYSYGWHRAEILAALANGVFLLALCLSIFLEAIQRFVSKPDVSNPKLVVIVGSVGLAFNLFGLFLFHDHDHDHGPPRAKADDAVRQNTAANAELNLELRSCGRVDDDTYFGHPAVTRQAVVQAALELQQASSSSLARPEPAASSYIRTDKYRDEPSGRESESATEVTIVPGGSQKPAPNDGRALEFPPDITATLESSKPPPGGHNRKAGAMNMRALVLHVLGDALGNVGVIISGLIIWLTKLSWRSYFDPIISLVITVIIFSSALPLVKSASFILLQGVPAGISLEEVKNTVLRVEGVEEVHELHIWQLSESKLIASLHVRTTQGAEFMQVAADIKKHLHDRGIHSVTIQPEYDLISTSLNSGGTAPPATACLLTCQEDCNLLENACCPPPPAVG